MAKISISLTDAHAQMIEQVVQSGDYGSTSEVIREALREWKARRILGTLWDEGISSGLSDPTDTIDNIKAEARKSLDKG
ncbi:MAG: type II toxin-antitoxin system ParD family antitoxin [Desulfovibrio sp.]|nr:MAG: type II toxin-antitoxin system ParD family antitoxin [Desulfovibrio sp.]